MTQLDPEVMGMDDDTCVLAYDRLVDSHSSGLSDAEFNSMCIDLADKYMKRSSYGVQLNRFEYKLLKFLGGNAWIQKQLRDALSDEFTVAKFFKMHYISCSAESYVRNHPKHGSKPTPTIQDEYEPDFVDTPFDEQDDKQ